MTEKREVYKCNICGNIVEVLNNGIGQLVCCNQPMQLMKENSNDTADKEKHVPIIIGKTSKKVRVGSKKHPMEEKHYIMWIEAESEDGEITKVFLKPDMKPEAKFKFKVKSTRAYCNVHGLWRNL